MSSSDPVMAAEPIDAEPAEPAERGSRGIQSVEVGGQLLLALLRLGRALPLKTLAAEAGMTAAKAHPYLVSFGKLGLIAQDEASGHYGIGPLALQLGLVAQQQLDPVRVAGEALPALAAELGHTTALAVWGPQGPTMVRIETPPTPIHVVMRPGTVMSLAGTASGLLFAAHRPRGQVRALFDAERARGAPGARIDFVQFERQLAEVRLQGLATVADTLVPGINAMAAPVFDPWGELALSLTVIGPSATLDMAPQGAPAELLRAAARAASQRLGSPRR